MPTYVTDYFLNLLRDRAVKFSNPNHDPKTGEFISLYRGVAELGIKNNTGPGSGKPIEYHEHGDTLLREAHEDHPNYGTTWGDEKTAKFYGDAGNSGTVIKAKFPTSKIKNEPNGFTVESGTLGEIEEVHIKTSEGWKRLPHSPGSTIRASAEIEINSLMNHIIENYSAFSPEIVAAGIAVQAKDTGRVLMLQRALTPEDPASGKWEFPGGKIDPGETPIQAAIREFQEESGLKLPKGDWSGQWTSSNQIYKGFILRIPAESDLDLNPDHEDRHVLNPDDPDGDNIEVIAWWAPSDLVQNPALRDELHDTDWMIFRQAQAQSETKALIASRFNARLTEFYNKCHDESTGKFCEDPVTKKQVKIERAPDDEIKAAKAKAKAWIRIAKVPNAAEVAKGKVNALKAKQGQSHRTTTEDRGGSAEARRKQRENLFTEFGGDKRGYVVDHQSGIKMHYTDDPALNPNQYPMFTRGRIFTGIQGGGYTLDNLLPESFETNRKRGSRPIRKENLT